MCLFAILFIFSGEVSFKFCAPPPLFPLLKNGVILLLLLSFKSHLFTYRFLIKCDLACCTAQVPAQASVAAAHGFHRCGSHRFQSPGSVVVAHRPSFPASWGSSWTRDGIRAPALAGRFLTTDHQVVPSAASSVLDARPLFRACFATLPIYLLLKYI